MFETPEGIRDAILRIYGVATVMSRVLPAPRRKVDNMLCCVWYACTQTWSRKRRTLMDIPAMVDGWRRVIVALSIGHDKDTIDQAEFAIEELMAPLLTAPVKQLRAFWTALEQALQADPHCPFFVWRMFAVYGKVAIMPATDQAIIELKTALAREIAELVEQDVQPDLVDAIAGALKWRDPETLVQVRDAVKAGAQPKLVGKESCLFLEVAGVQVML